MKEVDINGDGMIDFDEFEHMMINGFGSKGPILGKR
jgi:hypothetical protein